MRAADAMRIVAEAFNKKTDLRPFHFSFCGADRDRTDDLLNAIQALSQLSYSPNQDGQT